MPVQEHGARLVITEEGQVSVPKRTQIQKRVSQGCKLLCTLRLVKSAWTPQRSHEGTEVREQKMS